MFKSAHTALKGLALSSVLVLSIPNAQATSFQFNSSFIKDSLSDIGMWKGHKKIGDEFFTTKETIQLKFMYGHHMQNDSFFESSFHNIINRIHQIIVRESSDVAEGHNGLTHYELAKRITKVSLCFGNDPYMVTAKLLMETKFDRSLVSPTGAVGFSQMTGIGVDEVNDQLQNRGEGYAPIKNDKIFRDMAACYLGNDTFEAMFEDGTIEKGSRATRSKITAKAGKQWIRDSLDRDLIYGNILLKTLVAANFKEGKNLALVYRDALADYNGDTTLIRGVPMREIYGNTGLKLYDYIRLTPVINNI